MKLSRHITTNPGFDLFSQFDDFVQRAFGGPSAAHRTDSLAGFGVFESEDSWVLRTDLPGFTRDDVDISLTDGVVTVHAKREADDRQFYSELRRSFRVPEGVAADRIEARLDHGVLELVLPKSEEAKPKTIAIEVN